MICQKCGASSGVQVVRHQANGCSLVNQENAENNELASKIHDHVFCIQHGCDYIMEINSEDRK